jgi:hypothetical protein
MTLTAISLTVLLSKAQAKVDLQGEFVRTRSEELQQTIQYLVSSYPEVLSLPITKTFLQVAPSPCPPSLTLRDEQIPPASRLVLSHSASGSLK